MKYRSISAILSALIILPAMAFGQDSKSLEKIGRLSIDEVLLRPTYISNETAGGEFNFGDSGFKVRWEKDGNISATIAVGSVLQKNVPAIYSSTEPADALGFYEAYADYQGIYGRVRAGLQPLNFGFYGAQPNGERIFQRPLIYSQHVFGLRDYGVSFFTAHNGYYTELIGHNGEVDNAAQDGNVWVTARWGWGNDRNLRVQMSAQTGRTKPIATTVGSTTLAGWDNTKSAIWRFGALSVNWYPRKWDVVAQITGGERDQNSQQSGIMSTQFEALNYIGRLWGAGFRHDQFEPNNKLSGDKQTQVSAVFFVKSEDATSLVSLIISKNFEEQNETPNDQMVVSWRLTPFVGR
jgi:hypothetical protein